MNLIPALYFPETTPDQTSLRRLLLFFDSIICYRPVENEPPIDETLALAGLLKEYNPVPLGNDRERFLKFIKDVKQYGEEYHEGLLSSLSFQASRDAREPSTWSLVDSLTKKDQAGEKSPVPKALWQARLILKLAEIQAGEEMEILRGIRAAEVKKQEIMTSLKGDDEQTSPDIPLPHPGGLLPHTLAPRAEQLLLAWSQLFLNDVSGERPWIITTAQDEAAGLLLDNCGKDHAPVALGSITLPGLNNSENKFFLSERAEKKLLLKKNFDNIIRILQDLAFTKDLQPGKVNERSSAFAGEAADWKKGISDLEKAAGKATAYTIVFYLLPGISLPEILSGGKDSKVQPSAKEHFPVHGIISVLGKGH